MNLAEFCEASLFVLTLCLSPFLVVLALISHVFAFIFIRKEKKSVTNETAVVTGSGHGLGRQIALDLAQRGCSIAVVDINVEGAENTAQQIRDTFNVPAKAYAIDVSNYEQVKVLHEYVCDDLGTPTILVNNAGILLHKNPMNPSVEDVQKMINVNLTAHFYTNKVFLPKMKELNKGHIVAISSVSAVMPLMYNSVYTSTKAAVRNLMRCLRLELKASNRKISTTTVFPYFINTNDQVNDILRKSKISQILPPLDGELVAKRIVEGILHNEEEIMIPEYNSLYYRLMEAFPSSLVETVFIAGLKFCFGDKKQLRPAGNFHTHNSDELRH